MQLVILHTQSAQFSVCCEAPGHSPGQYERSPPCTPSQAVDFVRKRQSEHDSSEFEHCNLFLLILRWVLFYDTYLIPHLDQTLLRCWGYKRKKRSHQSSRELLEVLDARREQEITNSSEQTKLFHYLGSVALCWKVRVVDHFHAWDLNVALVHTID